MSDYGEVTLMGTNFDSKAKDADTKTLRMKPYTRHELDVYGIAFDYASSARKDDGLTDMFGRLAEEISYKTNVLAGEDPITSIEQWQTLAWQAAGSVLTTKTDNKYLNLGVRASAVEDRLHKLDDALLSILEMTRKPLKHIHARLDRDPDNENIKWELLGGEDQDDLVVKFHTLISNDTALASKTQTLWRQKGERHATDWFGRTLENRFREFSGICAQQHESQESGGREGGKGSSPRQTAPSGGPSASNATSPAPSTQADSRLLVVSKAHFAALKRSANKTHSWYISTQPVHKRRLT